MSKKIAVIQFPGTNCEYESRRALKQAGFLSEFFRWNEEEKKIEDYDGYLIPGGFSYEDRVRSGALAARDPLMRKLKKQAELGKPIIGICNGAQILMESGLVPGLDQSNIGGALSYNNRGYLNFWVNIKNCSAQGRCAFNNFSENHFFSLPIAHGEGRFVVTEEQLKNLQENGQAVFRYCDSEGEIKNEYPINPNGSVFNLAGICNKHGNVLALMPHPERTSEGDVIFNSMKKYLDQGIVPFSSNEINFSETQVSPEQYVKLDYTKPHKTAEILVDMIITDNEAQSLENTLSQFGIVETKVRKFAHWEVGYEDEIGLFIDDVINSNELCNTSKEIPYINDYSVLSKDSHKILVRDKDDFMGDAKHNVLSSSLGIKDITSLKKGVLWDIQCSSEDWDKIMESGILFNHFAQDAFNYKSNSMPFEETVINTPEPIQEIFPENNYEEIIAKNLENVLTDTDFFALGEKKRGKVRDSYFGSDKVTMITTDRQSAFDRVLAAIPFKSQVLNQVSAWWFKKTKHIIPNYVLEYPDPCVVVGKRCEVLPVEVVVRGYLTGSTDTSAWVNYQNGVRMFCGNYLPEGMVKNQPFERPIVTPTTKFEKHDRNLSAEEIISEKMLSPEDWEYVKNKALELFEFGQGVALENDLILVDTKYEFGRDSDGNIILIDEIHTPDSSRYWIASSYADRFSQGQEPENIDKEFLRLWFKKNCDPYNDAKLPQAPKELVLELSRRYILLYEMITGEKFQFNEEPILDRIRTNLVGDNAEILIIMGSKSDQEWADKIRAELEVFDLHPQMLIASAHKVPEKVFDTVAKNNQKSNMVYITIAGRSNGLSGVVAANSIHPVIACPPFKDKLDMMVNINSTLQMPSDTPVLTILDPKNVAAGAVRILGLGDEKMREKVRARIQSVKEGFGL